LLVRLFFCSNNRNFLLYRSPVGFSTTTYEPNFFGYFPNSYAISTGWNSCRLNGERLIYFEYPELAILPEKKNFLDVFGSGLVLDPEDQLAIFFTLNGQLLGGLVRDFGRLN
jgi:hypothetical protein